MPQPVPYFGLTGGIACGKTTAAAFFSEVGAKVIDADAIGHDLLHRPGPVYNEVVRIFGSGILDAADAIDRKRLGTIIFSNPEKRRDLEAILHPRIIEKQDQLARKHHRENPHAVILVEAALIYEAEADKYFRKIVVAWCTPEQQVERLIAKTGMSKTEAEARIATQMPTEAKRRRADFVIDCSGTLEETRRQVRAIYLQLREIVENACNPDFRLGL
jgi:dephospho-CoA kinase